MEETANGGVVTLSYASSVDFVIVEFRISKNGTILVPASVVMSEDDYYEIQMIGNTVLVRGENYGNTWRCWELKEPSKIDRNRIPW